MYVLYLRSCETKWSNSTKDYFLEESKRYGCLPTIGHVKYPNERGTKTSKMITLYVIEHSRLLKFDIAGWKNSTFC